MNLWKSFGASIIGPGHVATGKPNQDSWMAIHRPWGDGIAVSDGLGSKPFSNFGSRSACSAVGSAFCRAVHRSEADYSTLAQAIISNWVLHLYPLEPRDCASTCLYGFCVGDGRMMLGMLGDGLAAVLKTDGSVLSLTEDKSQGFSNVTSALSQNSSVKDWRHLTVREEECDAILLCTDGVSDDLENPDGFVTGFVEEHRKMATVSANRRIRAMLEGWPTPKHSDDKTIACLCREEVESE
jgi:serine/threonine protein phosphatase PrpC